MKKPRRTAVGSQPTAEQHSVPPSLEARPIFQTMNMPEGGIYAFESPWSIINKLAWLNGCGPKAFLDHFYFARRREARLWDPAWAWIHDLTWRDGASPEPTLDGHPLSVALAVRAASGGGSFNQQSKLLWCRACIDAGWHSLLHQWTLGHTCIVHGQPLEDGCPTCGMDVELSKRSHLGNALYACKRCEATPKERWSPFPEPGLISEFERVGHAYLSWHRVAADAQIKDLANQSIRGGDDWAVVNDGFGYAPTLAAAVELPAALARLFPTPAANGVTVMTYTTRGGCEIMQLRRLEPEHADDIAEKQLAVTELLAGMVRELTDELAGNHGCLSRASTVTVRLSGSQGYAEGDQFQACPIEFALGIWRWRVEQLREALCEEGWLPSIELDPESLGQVLRSDFYLTLSEVLEEFGRKLTYGALRMFVATHARPVLVERIFLDAPAPSLCIRAVVDYADWVPRLPCRALGPYPVI